MKWTYIDEKDAPADILSTALDKRREELTNILAGIPKGKVAMIQSDTQTRRGLRSSIARIANKQGWKAECWAAEGLLYVKRS